MTLRLAPFDTTHFATLLSWFATEAELVQWAGPFVRPPLDADKLAAMLAEGRTDPPGRLCWSGLDGDDVVAHAQVVLDHASGVARLARVAVAPPRRGQGLATPFLRKVLARTWAMPEIVRIELRVRCGNEPARRAYERLGFVPEGIARQSVRVENETWDIALYGVMRDLRP